jgi:hypothetical protein
VRLPDERLNEIKPGLPHRRACCHNAKSLERTIQTRCLLELFEKRTLFKSIRSGAHLLPSALIWLGIAVAFFFAAAASLYGAYRRWRARGRFTADLLYHRIRFEIAMRALAICTAFTVVLGLLLGISN